MNRVGNAGTAPEKTAFGGKLDQVPLREVVQVVAFSNLSGVLFIEGASGKGAVLFSQGGIVVVHSQSSTELILRAAREKDPRSQASFRRIQALVALNELFDLKEGTFRFKGLDGPVKKLGGVDVRPFYTAGPMNTGDLLLILARATDSKERGPNPTPRTERPGPNRRHTRYGPTAIQAELAGGAASYSGYLTNLSLGGAFFHCEDVPPERRVLKLKFTLPEDDGPCLIAARVAWAEKEKKDSRRGAGLSFEKITDESKAKIIAYLKRFQRLASGLQSAGGT